MPPRKKSPARKPRLRVCPDPLRVVTVDAVLEALAYLRITPGQQLRGKCVLVPMRSFSVDFAKGLANEGRKLHVDTVPGLKPTVEDAANHLTDLFARMPKLRSASAILLEGGTTSLEAAGSPMGGPSGILIKVLA